MGNFSSKDGHGPSGPHLDLFHTPPTSPAADVSTLPQLIPPTAERPLTPTPTPAAAPLPTAKKPQLGTTPSKQAPPPDGKPTPAVSPSSSVIGPQLSPIQTKPGSSSVSLIEQVSSGQNGGPSSSDPRTPISKGENVAPSPDKSPLSLDSESPSISPSGQPVKERDSGLFESPVQSQGAAEPQDEELEKLVEECKTLGITPPGGDASTAELLRLLMTEVKNLRNTLQVEREEWLQFQADLQVAVAVADRLRAEAEEELTTMRTAHKDLEKELVAAQQRQKETDGHLVTLRAELKENRQRMAALTQAPAKSEDQASSRAQERPSAEPNTCDFKEEPHRGRERRLCKVGKEGMQRVGEIEGVTNFVTEEVKTDHKGIAKRYLKNITNEEKSPEEGRTNETPRIVTTERSRSLSRLPVSSDNRPVQNGTAQSNTAPTAGSTNKDPGQSRERRSLERQDSWSSTQTVKREETLNKYNTALGEVPPSKSQDGFNLLLRRHGGSKRNSLLRWCQSRTQDYKNIEITNFSSSWADGLAFCAVYHTYLPSHIPYCTLSPESKRENLSLAFKTGENVGITQSLTVEEMLRLGGPDWQRVLSYVESMYRHFEM